MWHEFPGFTPTWRITPKFGLNFINLLVYFLPRQFGFRFFSLGSFSIALIFPNGGWNTSLIFTLKFFPLFHNLPCWICKKRSRQKLANNNTKSTVCKRLFILGRHEWHKPHRSQVVPIFMRTPPPVIIVDHPHTIIANLLPSTFSCHVPFLQYSRFSTLFCEMC